MAEVVTIGEAMMRSVESPYGILQTVGGSELNLCASLSQLNRSSKWISALGDDQSGQRIINESKRLGIDTSAVSFSPIYPTGEYRVDFAAKQVTYQRENSAFANLSSLDLAQDLRNSLRGSKWLHLTGITPMLGDSPRGLWSSALAMAELDGINISLDFNHRTKLGEWDGLWEIVEPHLRKVHLLTLSVTDLKNINLRYSLAPNETPIEELLNLVRRKWLVTWVACSVKEQLLDGSQLRWSAISGPSGVESTRSTPLPQCPVEALGGGDAWVAALLDGMMANMQISDAIIRADRYAILVQTCPGDLSTITAEQLDGEFTSATLSKLVDNQTIAILRGDDPIAMRQRAKELINMGYSNLEVTLDSRDAFLALAQIRADSPPDICIGVGTVSDPEGQLPKANALGATFCLAPNHPKGMIEIAKKLNMVPIVGAKNIVEVSKAVELGAQAVKLFHAGTDWNEAELRSVQDKFPATTMVPVGGIGPDDRQYWEDFGFILLGMGEKLAQLSTRS